MVGARISICHLKKIRYNVIDFWEDSEQIFEVYVSMFKTAKNLGRKCPRGK